TEHARLYFDLIHHHLSEAARRALRDMMPANYEYQSDFARKYYGQGKAEGKAEGIADIVGKQLTLRFGPLDEATRSRIAAASSTELEEIAKRLLTAPTLDAALDPAEDSAHANT
ncbi:MAG TPA: DUF4351 domain-containing protein, partial [Steroidobacter sp.]|uniref:DUF4351 domain-containing protein n=1 Tax=Steroidobacter sp. TaxID=1978227 RepID=UPI002ED77876